jgi:hypothetical protein
MVTAPKAQTVADTVWAYGGPDTYEGRFETQGGQPDWQGWTHEDLIVPEPNHWHASDYWAENLEGKEIGNHALYCGDETIPACDQYDPVGGVGTGWWDEIEWRHVVADTNQATTVRLTGLMLYDLPDAGWDFLELWVERDTGLDLLESWTGSTATTVVLDYSALYAGGDYVGPGRDEIRLMWRLWTSTDGWDDEDCISPSHGGCQIDDLGVTLDDVLITFDDFEDGTTGSWTPVVFPGVGDFANLRNDLGDRDPCNSGNATYQVNFVDDGLVVPGTGGTPCITHCYDPGGWIVNNDGGLSAADFREWFLHNRITSPPVAWPAGKDGAELAFDVYRDELLDGGSPGVFYTWYVRSTASEDPADLEQAVWINRSSLYNGGPEYFRHREEIGDLLATDRRWVQIALDADESGWIWGWNGSDGTPAPYFDNVGLRAWDPQGPDIHVREVLRFGDAFPAGGVLDPADLAANSCRVDASFIDTYGVRGDSMVVEVASLRNGAAVSAPPVLHWVLQANPVFDPVRPAAPDGLGQVRGSGAGNPVSDGAGGFLPDLWFFDLQDSGFFFPGDRLRWYITAADDLAGDVRTAVWPPDTTGVADFGPVSAWSGKPEIRALPSVAEPSGGSFPHPSLLLVDLTTSYGDVDAWIAALGELGLDPGTGFDILGAEELEAAATLADLARYETMIFASESQPYALGSSGADPDNPELVGAWLDLGGRQALFSGEQIVGSIGSSYPLELKLGVYDYVQDITTVNGGARELQVTPAAGNGILPDGMIWTLTDGCPDDRQLEAIGRQTQESTMAATLDPVGGFVGGYGAVVAVDDAVLGNRTLVVPFDLGRIDGFSPGGAKAHGFSPPARFLNHLLFWLGAAGAVDVSAVPELAGLTVAAHPNPFNPATTISFALPRAGAVTLEIFDIQGRKVRTLLDDQRFEAGHHEQPWDGRDGTGRGVSSGVYFYRFAAGAEERVGKLTLLK